MKKWMYMLMAAIVATAMVACSDDDPAQGEQGGNENEGGGGGNEQVETEKVSVEDLLGHWQCSFQRWTVGDKNHSTTYPVEEDMYYLKFMPDMRGYIGSEEDKLMGIDAGRSNGFEWSVSDGKISTKMRFSSIQTEWLVEKYSENTMTLSCQVGDETITCNFQRNINRGVYKPVIGDKVVRIRKYNLRNWETMERVENYEYEYDEQNRIKTVRHTTYDGGRDTYTTKYEYVEDTIKITDNYGVEDIILIGKNGYIRHDKQNDYPIVSDDIKTIVHDEEGYLSEITFGKTPLEAGTIQFAYADDEYSYSYETYYDEYSRLFGYNIEVPNNTSINLPAVYLTGAYYLDDFDFYGKRIPNVVTSYKELDRGESEGGSFDDWYNFELDMEHNGRVSKITRSDRISPDVWEIYYED